MKEKIKKVICYELENGERFDNEINALNRQKEFEFVEWYDNQIDNNLLRTNGKDIMDWLKHNKQKILDFLKDDIIVK